MKTQYDYWKEDHDQVMKEMSGTMNYSLHTTRDNRYFKHGIQIHGMLNFHEVRNWFSQTYGFASNLSNDLIDNEHWSFHIVYQTYMIYVKDDAELTAFLLRWS
jgi:hypothetical protein